MRSPFEMFLFIATLTGATMITRFSPFFLPKKWSKVKFIEIAKIFLPGMILLLLVVYSLKDTSVLKSPYGLPELISLLVVVGLHLWKRNALISIASGTACYMILTQTKCVNHLLGV